MSHFYTPRKHQSPNIKIITNPNLKPPKFPPPKYPKYFFKKTSFLVGGLSLENYHSKINGEIELRYHLAPTPPTRPKHQTLTSKYIENSKSTYTKHVKYLKQQKSFKFKFIKSKDQLHVSQ